LRNFDRVFLEKIKKLEETFMMNVSSKTQLLHEKTFQQKYPNIKKTNSE